MNARLYANENFPVPAVLRLRQFGHDVLTTLEAGKAEQAISDPEVLRFAHQHTRAVITFNRKDFVRLHQLSDEHSGIIVCSFDADFMALAERVHQALLPLDTLAKQLIRVNRPS